MCCHELPNFSPFVSCRWKKKVDKWWNGVDPLPLPRGRRERKSQCLLTGFRSCKVIWNVFVSVLLFPLNNSKRRRKKIELNKNLLATVLSFLLFLVCLPETISNSSAIKLPLFGEENQWFSDPVKMPRKKQDCPKRMKCKFLLLVFITPTLRLFVFYLFLFYHVTPVHSSLPYLSKRTQLMMDRSMPTQDVVFVFWLW